MASATSGLVYSWIASVSLIAAVFLPTWGVYETPDAAFTIAPNRVCFHNKSMSAASPHIISNNGLEVSSAAAVVFYPLYKEYHKWTSKNSKCFKLSRVMSLIQRHSYDNSTEAAADYDDSDLLELYSAHKLPINSVCRHRYSYSTYTSSSHWFQNEQALLETLLSKCNFEHQAISYLLLLSLSISVLGSFSGFLYLAFFNSTTKTLRTSVNKVAKRTRSATLLSLFFLLVAMLLWTHYSFIYVHFDSRSNRRSLKQMWYSFGTSWKFVWVSVGFTSLALKSASSVVAAVEALILNDTLCKEVGNPLDLPAHYIV